jgi:hypothetical protein
MAVTVSKVKHAVVSAIVSAAGAAVAYLFNSFGHIVPADVASDPAVAGIVGSVILFVMSFSDKVKAWFEKKAA